MRILKFNRFKESAPGQSLVEMAIITPLLIFFLIGVFEVGWALRNYLVLVNVNREITRFAVRPGYLDFSSQDSVITSYKRVREWVDVTLSGQIALDFNPITGNATLKVSHLVIDSGIPCADINTNPANCDCNRLNDPTFTNTFALDDIIVRADRPGMEYQATTYGPEATKTGTHTTQLKYQDLLYNAQTGLVTYNAKFNCELIKKGGLPSSDNIIVTELFVDLPQLFGFPLISNPFTDPIPLYTQTKMRLVGGARSSGGTEASLGSGGSVGPICLVYPFAVRDTALTGAIIGQTKIDILHGGNDGGSHYGWLAWNAGKVSQADLENELKFVAASLNQFVDPVSGDKILSRGDWAASLPNRMENVNASPKSLVNGLVGKNIRIPVWNSFNTNRYQISDFVWVKIEKTSEITLSTSQVMAIYQGSVGTDCP